jgi:2-methylisocitrate lyase-like PEP mutase family enzyme
MSEMPDIADLVTSVDLPVNVLARPDGPNVSELAAIGVKRISVGGAFALAGLGAVSRAAREFLSDGTFGFFAGVAEGAAARDAAFGAA